VKVSRARPSVPLEHRPLAFGRLAAPEVFGIVYLVDVEILPDGAMRAISNSRALGRTYPASARRRR
jgi:hypothetical protein